MANCIMKKNNMVGGDENHAISNQIRATMKSPNYLISAKYRPRAHLISPIKSPSFDSIQITWTSLRRVAVLEAARRVGENSGLVS
jgi:hypothetical protein